MSETQNSAVNPFLERACCIFVGKHRYYMWANRMRVHFDEKVPVFAEQLKKDPDIWTNEGIEAFMYMSYWYAGLYVVVEGWRELKLSDTEVDALLVLADNVALLKKYRDGVYHYQKDYFDRRFVNFMTKGQNIVVWFLFFLLLRNHFPLGAAWQSQRHGCSTLRLDYHLHVQFPVLLAEIVFDSTGI